MGLISDKNVYSYSQLSSFDSCPYSYYLQRIEKIPETLSNGFAERGSLIHDLLDKWAKKILTKEQMKEEYIRRYPEEVVTAFPRMLAAKGYTQKSYEQGIEFLENFDEFDGYEIVSAEEKFTIDLPLTDGTSRKFTGIIDMILRKSFTDDLIICDHKSKSLSSFKKNEDEMYHQQLLYAAYMNEKYGKWPSSCMFHLFNEGGLKTERLFTLDQFRETIAWASDLILRMEKYTVMDWLECKEKGDFSCWFLCNVRNSCQNGKMPPSKKKKDEDYYEQSGD